MDPQYNRIFSRGKDLMDVTGDLFSQSLGKLQMGYNDMKIDIQDNADAYVVLVDLPGIKQEDIHLDYNNETLSIKATRLEEAKQEDADRNYVKRERTFGSFSRSIYIPNVRTEAIEATYKKNGTLDIVLPKLTVEPAPASTIKINREI